MRVRLIYLNGDGSEAGSRFYLSYAGAAPTAGNCATIASDIASAWASHLGPNIINNISLIEVDVLDIASLTGASGEWTGTNTGGIDDTPVPSNCAVNVEFDISRRYRGGKPRMFLPAPGAASLSDSAHWSTGYTASVNTGIAAFMTEIEALSVGAVGALAHVNLSYYTGFKNITNSSGRERAVPQYRDAALLDTITGYNTKRVVGSQRRRRTATTP